MGVFFSVFCFCFLVFALSFHVTGSGSDLHKATLEIEQVLLSLGSVWAGDWPESSPKAEPLFLSDAETWCLPRACGTVLTGLPPAVPHTACLGGDVWTSRLRNVLWRNLVFLERVPPDQWGMTAGPGESGWAPAGKGW